MFVCSWVHGQGALGSWNTLHLRYGYSPRLSLFAEVQLRSLRFYHHFHYYEYKGGFISPIYSNVYAGLGLGKYETYREGGNFVLPKNNSEMRLWSHLSLMEPIGKLKIEQRYRIEMRFTQSGYRNRFRYRLSSAYPFFDSGKGYSLFLLSAASEIFFTDKEPYFERHRFNLALNCRFSPHTSLQVGYLYQFDYRINDEIGTCFLQVGLFIELSSKRASFPVLQPEIREN
ncbi:MAG: DUF2490 domain-containing protein [Cytophagales bacterium]|nr:DUF2490 domain-containing protein [Bernardetiaceae bacterium]MDW8210584.1 DUF2490 domain-containing protein [Cytophagales bacterium]